MTQTSTQWVEGHFVGGHVVLDFANTVYRRWPQLGADLLTDADALGRWFEHAGLMPADSELAGAVTEALLSEGRALRALLWDVLDAQRDGEAIPASALTSIIETAYRGSPHLAVGPHGSMTSTRVEGALAILALHAIALVLGPPPQGVRACDRCGWFFVDSSRGMRRRWCSMTTCGNQAKADRYRATHNSDRGKP